MKKEKNIYERYGYYREYINKISKFPLGKPVKTNELQLSRGAVQMAYKEIKEKPFSGNILDYLVWTACFFMLTLWSERRKTLPAETGKDALEILKDLMNERPQDALVMLRGTYTLGAFDIMTLSDKKYADETIQRVIWFLGDVGVKLQRNPALLKGKGLDRLIKYHLSIQ